MLTILGVLIASVIGSAAWLYQRAWERQQVRIERYQAILDRLPGFTQANIDPAKIDEALIEIRRLWLFAPDNVVKAANGFIEAVEKGDTKRPVLAKLVLAMRCDASFTAALFPRFRNKLTESDVSEIKIATRKSPNG